MSVVGIDLGTTNTVVACVRSGKVHVLADEHGARLLPSVVSFHPNGEVLVGASAKSRRIIDPKNTVYSHKRLIGRSWGSPEIAQAKSRFAFELKEGPGQGPLIRARNQDYTLPEISAFVLKRARQIAETALGSPVERAVITVPAHFNELQRASTKVAGRVSGLEVLRILNEPTAAALAYGLGRTGNERVAVYDFGGGTFDCTLLDLNGNVFEVLATAGDSFLGGDDVDNLIAERMAETYLKAHRYDPRTDPQMLERLKTTAEDIKMVLSTAETHTVVLKEFGHGAQGSSINFTFTMTRRDLEHMMMPLVDRTFKVTQDALSLARLTPTSFDKIILVGGSTRAPLVRKRVEAFFGQAPLDRVNPDEVVAIGAAIQAAALTEGARKRSIPAPPSAMAAKPRTFPGTGAATGNPTGDSLDNTQTGTIDPTQLDGKPAAAFSSGPPTFGFHPASSPPAAPGTKSAPPPGPTGALNAQQQGGPRKITSPGVQPGAPGNAGAPRTQPMGAQPPAQSAGPLTDEDPSIASFPDLGVPTPFEWFPSAGDGGQDDTTAGSAGAPVSVAQNTLLTDTIAGNAPTSPGLDPSVTANLNSPFEPAVNTKPRPAAGSKPFPSDPALRLEATTSPGFGAIDEPPSLMSTPSASVPSFPSLTPGGSNMPSPIGEPEPFRSGSLPDGVFGEVRDLSLISSSGNSGVSGVGGERSAELGFGHVADLSLVSSSSATAQLDDITEARNKLQKELEEEVEDSTEANIRPPVGVFSAQPAPAPKPVVKTQLGMPAANALHNKTMQSPAAPPPVALVAKVESSPTLEKGSGLQLEARAPAPLGSTPEDDSIDLPMVAQPSDLPSVVQPKGKRPEIRKPGQPGMTLSGGPSMIGKPPPVVAPQPFGPMEKIGEGVTGTGQRTAAMPAAQARSSPERDRTQQPPPAPPSQRPGQAIQGQPARQTGAPARTSAMPARTAQPIQTTAPMPQAPPPSQPGRPPAFGAGLPNASFGSAPPNFGGAPPPSSHPGMQQTMQQTVAQTAPMANAPPGSPHMASPLGAPPPYAQQQNFGSAPPPQAYPSAPPQGYPSAPPPFGSVSPPAGYPMQSAPPTPFSQPPQFGSPADAPLDLNAMGGDYNPSTAMMPGGPQQQPQHTVQMGPGQSMPPQRMGFAAPVLVDVTPRGLIVETAGGYTDTIIPRNAKIPCERTRRFATGRDMQTTVRVRVAQGEANVFPQNTFLGEVELSGLRPAPRGEVVVAVTFEVDADGTLRVRARDVQTGQEARATLQLIGVADESSVVMMINRFAQQPVVGEQSPH